MRITFSDVRKEAKKTYFFVSDVLSADFRFCLDRDAIPYEHYTTGQQKNILPPDFQIPPVRTMPIPNITRLCKHPVLFVTDMNVDDLAKKLELVALAKDDDLIARHAKMNNLAMDSYKTSYTDVTGIPIAKN